MSLIQKLKNYSKAFVLGMAATTLLSTPVKAKPKQTYSYVRNVDLSQLELKLFESDKNNFESDKNNFPYIKTDKKSSVNNLGIKISLPKLAAYSAIALPTTLILHELGHAATFKLLGCNNVGVNFFNNSSVVSVKCNSKAFYQNFNDYEKNLFSINGVETSTNFSHYLYQSLKTNSIPQKIKPLIATMALFAMFDRHRYLWSGAIRHYLHLPSPPSHDFMDIMDRLFAKTDRGLVYAENDLEGVFEKVFEKGHFYQYGGDEVWHRIDPVYLDSEGKWRERLDKNNYVHYKSGPCPFDKNMECAEFVEPDRSKENRIKDIAYGIGLGMSVLELGLRFKEIKYLVSTALGNNPAPPEGFEVIKAGFYPIKDGFIISIDGVHDWF